MPVSIAAIKITQKQAGISDDAYRALLNEVAGVTSAKDLTPMQRVAVYARLKDLEKQAASPLIRKLFGLFYHIHQKQPIRNPSAWLLGLIAKVNRLPEQPKCLNNLPPAYIQKAIEALKMRH